MVIYELLTSAIYLEQYGNVTEVRFHMSVINMNVIERPEENVSSTCYFKIRSIVKSYFLSIWMPKYFYLQNGWTTDFEM